MVTFPPCKINLGLRVLSKRQDGYHDISTCFFPLPFTDVLEILPSDKLTFTQTGLAVPGEAKENLCLKAYHLLLNEFELPPVHIHLHKIIPMGAGLGGGSSDAAWTLRTVNSIFDLRQTASQLSARAAEIGSDCPFFIQDFPAIGSGRGEILEPSDVNLSGFFMVLVKPEIHVSTDEAYRNVKPEIPSTDIRLIVVQPMRDWKANLINDFEQSVFKKHPDLSLIKDKLYSLGAVYASMSGSGSAVYGIFDKQVSIENHFSGQVCWAGWL